MKIDTFPQDDHQVKLVVEVDSEEMEKSMRRAARQISNRTKIPGFRPGKAPYDIVLRYIGEGQVTEEAVELLVDEIYPKVLEEADIKPAAPGSLEKVESIKPPKFTFRIPLEPTVDLGEYQSIRLSYEWQSPDETKVDESIEDLRKMYATTETVERPIQEGDFVMADIVGHKDKSDKGDDFAIDRPNSPIFIRPEKGKVEDWPFPGFSRQLIDLAPGDSKTISHHYEKNFTDDELRGRTINFVTTIKTIRGVNLPNLDDDFAKQVGSFESLSALRDAVRANISQQSKLDYDNDYFMELIDKIIKGAIIKYPPQVLDHEIEHVLNELEQRLTGQGMDMDTYLKSRNLEREKYIEEEVKPISIRRLERSLILEQVARAENVTVSDEALQNSFQQTYREIQANQQFQKSVRGKQPSTQLVNAIASESAGRAITQLTLDRLKEIANSDAIHKDVDKKQETTDVDQSDSKSTKSIVSKKSGTKAVKKKSSVKNVSSKKKSE